MIIERLDNGNVEISINGNLKFFNGFYVIHKLRNSCGIFDARQLLLEVSVDQITTITANGENISFTDNDSLYNILKNDIFVHDEGVKMNAELDTQTVLLKEIQSLTSTNDCILEELKKQTELLSKIYN